LFDGRVAVEMIAEDAPAGLASVARYSTLSAESSSLGESRAGEFERSVAGVALLAEKGSVLGIGNSISGTGHSGYRVGVAGNGFGAG